MKIGEIMLVEPSRIVKVEEHAIHVFVVLEGKNYDIWLPYERAHKKIMIKMRMTVDGQQIQFIPGCLPTVTAAELGYEGITIRSGKKVREIPKEELITM